MRTYSDPKYELSYASELLVTEMLQDSRYVNKTVESHLPYDIIWNDIKIDVKATSRTRGNSTVPFYSFTMPHKHQHNIIFINVYIHKDKESLFFVAHTLNSRYRYGHNEAVKANDLPRVVTELHSKYNDIAEEMRMSNLDMTNTTLEVPKYLKDDLKALAIHSTKEGHPRKSMKAYLVELIATEKKKAKL